MGEAFERVLFDAANSDSTIQDEEYVDDNEKVDWDINYGNIEARRSPLVIEFAGANTYRTGILKQFL
ncbi:hypothetical protein Y032_0022g647 [Ancylostoma ceylanicum]|uniref:Uncharacterized protein n=1 Tax=Ancylostoma ceylanicum TaxID=53326 RepID=A0A016V171_9BILA|nr:hypothetical protein Y032_0022g647 [Ancylostoma ceylanicum]